MRQVEELRILRRKRRVERAALKMFVKAFGPITKIRALFKMPRVGARMRTALTSTEGRHLVPGRQPATHYGLRFRVSPDFWIRRFHLFPFFFESTNPTFRVDVERVSDPEEGDSWRDDTITLRISFADGSTTKRTFPVPDLKVGERARLQLESVYTSQPGQTIITLPTFDPPPLVSMRSAEWKTLYSYNVRTEEQLWLWSLGPLIGIMFGAGTTLMGVAIQAWLG